MVVRFRMAEFSATTDVFGGRISLEGCVKVSRGSEPSGFEGAFSASDTAYIGRRQHIVRQ